MKRAAEIATHKASIASYVTIAAGLLGYGGVSQIGIPTFDAIAIKMNEIENKQESSILLMKDEILWLKTDLHLRYPKRLLDSVRKEIILQEFWENQ